MLVDTFKWMYQVFKDNNVDIIVNGGDLVDSDVLKAREISALSEALSYRDQSIPEYHILGNHEMEDKASKFSSISIISQLPNAYLVTEPTRLNDDVAFLPYTNKYDTDLEPYSAKVLISHNDYEGMRVNRIVMQKGFNIDLVSEDFQLILNGHIHAASGRSQIVNIGSVVGHNFGDNYNIANPSIMILDTDTLDYFRIPNPYAILFHKIKADSLSDIIKSLDSYKSNSTNRQCLRIEVPVSIRESVQDYLDNNRDNYNIVATRIITHTDNTHILLDKKEDIDVISDYGAGITAMSHYVDNQEDSDLPATKSDIMNFIKEYLE